MGALWILPPPSFLQNARYFFSPGCCRPAPLPPLTVRLQIWRDPPPVPCLIGILRLSRRPRLLFVLFNSIPHLYQCPPPLRTGFNSPTPIRPFEIFITTLFGLSESRVDPHFLRKSFPFYCMSQPLCSRSGPSPPIRTSPLLSRPFFLRSCVPGCFHRGHNFPATPLTSFVRPSCQKPPIFVTSMSQPLELSFRPMPAFLFLKPNAPSRP